MSDLSSVDQPGRCRQLSQQLATGVGGHPGTVGGYFHLGQRGLRFSHLESAFL